MDNIYLLRVKQVSDYGGREPHVEMKNYLVIVPNAGDAAKAIEIYADRVLHLGAVSSREVVSVTPIERGEVINSEWMYRHHNRCEMKSIELATMGPS